MGKTYKDISTKLKDFEKYKKRKIKHIKLKPYNRKKQ